MRAIIKVHVRGALDDEQFLRAGCLCVQLLAMPERAGFAAGDNEEWLGQESFSPAESAE